MKPASVPCWPARALHSEPLIKDSAMHPDLEQLQRYLHGELPPLRAEVVRKHLSACAECQARFDTAEREEAELNALFQQLDHVTAPTTVNEIVVAARKTGFNWYKRAAVVLLALGVAGTAYAIPGSPVRAWVRSLLVWNQASRPALPSAPEVEPSTDHAGIEVEPGSYLMIDFTAQQNQGDAVVSLTDSGKVII